MTITEESRTSENRNGHDGKPPALADQVVMSTVGVASQGLSTVRRLADDMITTVDRAVLGVLDIADQLVRSNVVTDITSKSVAITRDTWSTSATALRHLVADI